MKTIILSILFIFTFTSLLQANERTYINNTKPTSYFNFHKSTASLLSTENKKNDLKNAIIIRNIGIISFALSTTSVIAGSILLANGINSLNYSISILDTTLFTGVGFLTAGGLIVLAALPIMIIGMVLVKYFKENAALFVESHHDTHEIATGFSFRLNRI